MINTRSPQNWKKQAYKRKKQVVKKYQAQTMGVNKAYKNKSKITFKKLLVKLLKFGAIAVVIITIILAGLVAWYSKELPDSTDLLQRQDTGAAKFYDRTGEILLYDLGSGDVARTKIKLSDLPDYVKWTTLVAEDRKFYSHSGIDFKGILRSIYLNTFKPNTRVGGSSISQQFIKNALLSPEKTYSRKIKELVLTWQLERKFTKDEILEMYFNEIPYGGTAYGVEAASKKYFDKSAVDLTLPEAATLAALPQAPSYLSPYGSNIDRLLARKDWILDSLVEEGYMTQKEIDEAKTVELEFSNISSSIIAPHFIFFVKEQVAAEFGEQSLTEDGLKIITTIDVDKQKAAENSITEIAPKNLENYGASNAALVSVSATTGEILAMVGSKDYFDKDIDGAVNVAVRPRQPGSSFKPIVYTAAFAKGYSPDTILYDVKTTFKTDLDDYTPSNYNDQMFGPVSIRKAFAGSLNIPAVKTIYLTGIDNVIDLAEDLGYTTFEDRSRFGLSLVLGGGEVKLLEHVAAFTALANDGKYFKPQSILKITNSKNKTLFEFNPNKVKGKQVIDEDIARQTASVMSDNAARAYVFGEYNLLTLPDRPVAAKTGTTNDYKDGWTMGFTPDIVTGVWVGNTRGEAMKGAAAGGNVAAPIWNAYMREVTKDMEVKDFTPPKTKELPTKPMLNGQIAGETTIKIDKVTGKLATQYTPDSQIEELVFREVHNILHYVNKNNPQGSQPSEPWTDPNYTNWELSVQEWAKENGYEINVDLPTETDDVHTSQNIPSLEIINPSNNTTINSPELSVNVKTSSKRGIKKVEYWLDNTLLTEITESPFNLKNQMLIGFSNGAHDLKIIAKDDVDNQKIQTIRINLNLPSQYSNPATFIQPKSGDRIVAESFPYPVIINISNNEFFQKIDLYLKDASGNSKWLGYKEVSSTENTITWDDFPTSSGEYYLKTLITSNSGTVIESEDIKIIIE